MDFGCGKPNGIVTVKALDNDYCNKVFFQANNRRFYSRMESNRIQVVRWMLSNYSRRYKKYSFCCFQKIKFNLIFNKLWNQRLISESSSGMHSQVNQVTLVVEYSCIIEYYIGQESSSFFMILKKFPYREKSKLKLQ